MAIALLVSGVGNLWAGIHYTMDGVPSIDYSLKNAATLTSGKYYALYHVDGSKFFYANPSDNALYISSTKVTAFKFVSTSTQYYLLSDLGTVNKGGNNWTIKADGSYGNEGKWTVSLSDGKYTLKNNGAGSSEYLGTDNTTDDSKCYRNKNSNKTWYIIDLSDHSLAVSLLYQLNKAYDDYYVSASDGDAKTALGEALDAVHTDYVKAASFDSDTYNAGIEAIGAAIGAYLESKLPGDNKGVSLIDTKPTATGLDWNASGTVGTGSDVAQYYNQKGVTISRNIVLPVGYYRLTCIGLTRTTCTSVLSVSELANMNIATVASGTVNSLSAANTWFGKGYGVNELDFHITTAQEVNICLQADNSESGDHWTVWKNFKLLYLGTTSDKLLSHEISLDGPIITAAETAISDNSNVKGTEYNNLYTNKEALKNYSGSGTDEEKTAARKTLKYNVVDYTNVLKDAASSYNSLATAISNAQGIVDAGTNVGIGVFQIPSTAQSTLSEAISTANGVWEKASTTASGASDAATTLNTAITAYNSATLNAPDSEKRYTLTIHWADKDFNGNVITFIHNGRADQGLFALKYIASDANHNRGQAFKFTQVSGNKYKMSFLTPSGTEQYITTNSLAYGSDTKQIRTTDDASKALEIEIKITSTANQFQLYNTKASAVIASSGNEDMYTQNSANFSIAEASQASVGVKIDSDKWGTRIFPFAVAEIPDGLEAYTITGTSGDAIVKSGALATIPANTPVLLKASKNVNETLKGYGTAKQDSYTEGYLTGVYTTDDIEASVEPTASEPGEYRYVLQTQSEVQAFYKVTSAFTATEYRCYLSVPQPATGGGEIKAFYLDLNDETAVSSVKADELHGATIYNLAGQRVSKAQKGVYIINGKKVAVK